MSTSSVSRSRVVPGIVGHDRAARAGERVEQARLARVRPPDDHHLRAFAHQAAAAGVAPAALESADDRVDARAPRRRGSMKW